LVQPKIQAEVTMVSFVLGVMIAVACYYMGANHGRRVAMQAINIRVNKVMAKLTWEEKQSFNSALAQVIKEEKN
jgi:small basic protein